MRDASTILIQNIFHMYAMPSKYLDRETFRMLRRRTLLMSRICLPQFFLAELASKSNKAFTEAIQALKSRQKRSVGKLICIKQKCSKNGKSASLIVPMTSFLLIGAAMFVALTVIGKLSKHRDRTHSILALVLFSVSVFLIDPHIGLAFAIGYGSHLIIDLFNKSPIRMLYPLKKGICFKLCYADRLGNELLLVGGVFITVLYIFLHSLSLP